MRREYRERQEDKWGIHHYKRRKERRGGCSVTRLLLSNRHPAGYRVTRPYVCPLLLSNKYSESRGGKGCYKWPVNLFMPSVLSLSWMLPKVNQRPSAASAAENLFLQDANLDRQCRRRVYAGFSSVLLYNSISIRGIMSRLNMLVFPPSHPGLSGFLFVDFLDTRSYNCWHFLLLLLRPSLPSCQLYFLCISTQFYLPSHSLSLSVSLRSSNQWDNYSLRCPRPQPEYHYCNVWTLPVVPAKTGK